DTPVTMKIMSICVFCLLASYIAVDAYNIPGDDPAHGVHLNGINPDESRAENPADSCCREDFRCGPKHLAPNGQPAQCKHGDCCSHIGWCGNGAPWCSCKDCVDYRKFTKNITSGCYQQQIITTPE
ncbi:unnamed protein product, partial [Meganyctiphanes norvegica]